MKRRIPVKRLVSPSLSPNRTCKFPSIRLSMHDRGRGWASHGLQAIHRPPEVCSSRHERLVGVRIPSVWYLGATIRKVTCTSGSEAAKTHRTFAPTQFSAWGVALPQPARRRFTVFLAQPSRDALPQPPVQPRELVAGPGGVSVVVTPSGDDRVEIVDKASQRPNQARPFRGCLDLVAQVLELPLRDEEVADEVSRSACPRLHDSIAEELEAFLDSRDQSLLYRQLHAEFVSKERRKRIAFGLCCFFGSRYEDYEVVRVTNHLECRPTTSPIIESPVRRILWSLSGGHRPPSISLVDGRQIDVGQQRRDDPTLRDSRDRVANRALDHDPGLQECVDEPEHLAVPDASSHTLHLNVMVDGIEAAFDVALDHIRDRRRPVSGRVQELLDPCQRIMGASTAPEPIRGRREVRLEDGFQDQLQGHLHQSVFERGYSQWAILTRLARLRDQSLPDRFGFVCSATQFLSDFLEVPGHATETLFDLAPRYAVRAGRLASPVAGKPLPSSVERSAVAYQIKEIGEHLFRVRVTPPIQLALHVEDEPGIHRAGHRSPSCWLAAPTILLRHASGFPALGLLRGFRPTPSRSSIASIIFFIEEEATARFLGFVADLSLALGTDFTPCGIRPLATAGAANSWCVVDAPLNWQPPGQFGAPPILRSCRPLLRWRHTCSTGASGIGSVSLPLASSLTGPPRVAEVSLCPALSSSADLWLAGSIRLTSLSCSSRRAASRRVRGPPPREVKNDLLLNEHPLSSTTQRTESSHGDHRYLHQERERLR